MIGFIKGVATDTGDGCVILENNGMGYELTVSNACLFNIQRNKGREVCVFTYLSVRDDGISLYGFVSKEEKNMFLKLITISGVGPKAAIGILSGIDLNELMTAILSADVKRLSKIKGVGKKTAERIILELKEKIDADSKELLESLPTSVGEEETIDKEMADAISALRSLGFSQAEATDAVKKAKPFADTAEELVAKALRSM